MVARAPGRLDVMGGIADYSGSLVLQVRAAGHRGGCGLKGREGGYTWHSQLGWWGVGRKSSWLAPSAWDLRAGSQSGAVQLWWDALPTEMVPGVSFTALG